MEKDKPTMRFEQIEELGHGGTGKIYKAFAADLNRWVALKTLHPVLIADPVYQHRLKKEAEILARLFHPNIVSFIGLGSARVNCREETCLIMEYVEGSNFQERLNEKGPMHFEEIIPVFLGLCEAVSCLHRNHIFHLDLKPENILWSREGRLFLTDFGIASLRGSQDRTSPIHDPMGSLLYSSPEQVKGEECDGRSDLYSLGMIFYTLLNGKAYFEGRDKKRIWGDLVYEARAFNLAFPDTVPLFFQRMIRKLTAKNREERYRDIHSLLQEFCQYLARQSSSADFKLPASPAGSKTKSGNLFEKGIIFVSGMIVVLAAFFLWQRPGLFIQAPISPLPQEAPSSSLHSLSDALPPSSEGAPVLHFASLTREPAPEEEEGGSLAKSLAEDQLEKFLLQFKSNIENKNLHALKKEFALSGDTVFYFSALFEEPFKPELEIRQIKQEGLSISVHYRIRGRSSPPFGEGLLLFHDGAWHLNIL